MKKIVNTVRRAWRWWSGRDEFVTMYGSRAWDLDEW
jgi:hypothetical protein